MSRFRSMSGRVMAGLAAMAAVLAVAVPAANAYSGPTITQHETYTSYLNGYVPFTGDGFYSGWVRVVMLTQDLRQDLGTTYVHADLNGFIAGSVYDTNYTCSRTGGIIVWLAADGAPGPTAWTQASIRVPYCP
jgi:hypothetical protein